MKFLIDAQLPRRMINWLAAAGSDAVHTLDLPTGNRTSDAQVSEIADREQRIVITRDADFVDSHLLQASRKSSCSSQPATSRIRNWSR